MNGRCLIAPYHILLVDDDTLILQALKDHLEYQGYRVSLADDCLQAEETLRRGDKVDLVILDYFLADGTGTDLLRVMGESDSVQRPRVIMSSFVFDGTHRSWEDIRKRLPEISQSLIQAYVNKPYSFEKMDIALHDVLESHSGDYTPAPRLQRQSKIR